MVCITGPCLGFILCVGIRFGCLGYIVTIFGIHFVLEYLFAMLEIHFGQVWDTLSWNIYWPCWGYSLCGGIHFGQVWDTFLFQTTIKAFAEENEG